MKASEGCFEAWYNAKFDYDKADDDIKELFKEAFEAGMVSGAVYAQAFLDDMINDYKGFQNEN